MTDEEEMKEFAERIKRMGIEKPSKALPPVTGSPAFCARLHQALHAAITDPALRITIYRIVENLDKEGTSIFWDSDEHRIEFVGNGWALEFHQENERVQP